VSFEINDESQVKSSQVKYNYKALFTIKIESKLLHSIKQNNLTVFVYSWKKDIQDGSFN